VSGRAGKKDSEMLLLEEKYNITKAQLGSNHPQTNCCLKLLALGYQNSGKPDKALPLWEEYSKHNKAEPGSDSQEAKPAVTTWH
jgi:hypothetical protein